LADFSDGIRLAGYPLLAASLTKAPFVVDAVTAIQTLPWLLAQVSVFWLTGSICAGSWSSSTLRACW
jgi:hypothetical protein